MLCWSTCPHIPPPMRDKERVRRKPESFHMSVQGRSSCFHAVTGKPSRTGTLDCSTPTPTSSLSMECLYEHTVEHDGKMVVDKTYQQRSIPWFSWKFMVYFFFFLADNYVMLFYWLYAISFSLNVIFAIFSWEIIHVTLEPSWMT